MTVSRLPFAILLMGVLAAPAAEAQRLPVLKQIDEPHPYYYREMYLPQVTSGPSAAAWSPDGRELVYAMQGTLWRQKVGSREAAQLTDGPGYDSEPDWSPDGRRILYTSYRNDALELWVLDLRDGQLAPSGRQRRRQPRRALVARRLAHRVRLDGVQGTLARLRPLRLGWEGRRPSPCASPRTTTADCPATTTRSSTSTSRPPGRRTARS